MKAPTKIKRRNTMAELNNNQSTEIVVPEKKKKSSLKIVLFAALAVLVIAAGIFFIFPDHIDYFIAEKKFNSGEYEQARLAYWDLGDFKDSKQKVLLCHENIGDIYFEEGNYEDAVNLYLLAENTEKADKAYLAWAEYYVEYASYKNAIEKYEKITTMDVLENITEAEYLYLSAEKENHSVLQLEENYNRFKALADSGYKDSKEIFDKAYAWDAKVYLSNKADDYTYETMYKIKFNDIDSVKRSDKMYFTIYLQGGIPGESLELEFKASLPGGASKKESITLQNDEFMGWQLWYTSPSNAPTGNGTVKVYDKKTDKLLFTKKFKVTK